MPPALTCLSQNTCHHLWVFPIAILLPIAQLFHELDGMDKEDSLDLFFSVVPPKTKVKFSYLK